MEDTKKESGISSSEKLSPIEQAKKEQQEGESGETITISKKKFDRLVDRLDMLEETADRGRLAKWKAQHKDYENKRCRLYVWSIEKEIEKDGKKEMVFESLVVVGWSMWEDKGVERNARGIFTEIQSIQLALEDGTKIIVPYGIFHQRHKKIEAEIVKETKETIGGEERTIFFLKAANGKEYELDNRFVN